MPRQSKGPRLYLRKERDGSKRWIIRDKIGDTRTGFSEDQSAQAEAQLQAYIAGKFKPKRSKPVGFIYFVTCFSSPNYPIKIGWTFTPMETRLAQLQCGNPNMISVVATLVGTQEDERKLHLYFAHLHVRGEWFLRGADLLDYIGGIPGQVETYGSEEFEECAQENSARAQQQDPSTETNVNET